MTSEQYAQYLEQRQRRGVRGTASSRRATPQANEVGGVAPAFRIVTRKRKGA